MKKDKKIVVIRKHKTSNILLRISLIIFIFVLMNVIIASLNVYYKGKEKKKEITAVEKEFQKLKKERDEMMKEKKELKDAHYQETLARQQGLVKPGEILFKVIPKEKNVEKVEKVEKKKGGNFFDFLFRKKSGK